MDFSSDGNLIFSAPSPVKEIAGIWEFGRKAGTSNTCCSTHGHLLHYIRSGRYQLSINNCSYQVAAGDMIYYYEKEKVVTRFTDDVVFYSVSFFAPDFKPLPMDFRAFRAPKNSEKHFRTLYQASRSNIRRIGAYAAHSALLAILCEIQKIRPDYAKPSGLAGSWTEIEEYVRGRHICHPSLTELCGKFGLSPATLIRLCRKATGKTPGQYFKALRMEEARSLLLLSGMNISEIAEHLCYTRMHEFSREFSRHFGFPPSSLGKSH